MYRVNHRVTVIALATLAWIALAERPARGQFGIFRRGDKAVAYQTYKDPSGRFTIEYPAKDWKIVPASGSALALFTQKDGDASVLIDYTRLPVALEPAEIGELFKDLEVQFLRERQPDAKDVNAVLDNANGGARVVLKFSRTGVHGVEEVLQYSIPRGSDLYRVVGTTRADRAEKNREILFYVANSFAVAASR
jgi:hypothetical protein